MTTTRSIDDDPRTTAELAADLAAATKQRERIERAAGTPLDRARCTSPDETIRGTAVGAVWDCIDTVRAMLKPDPFTSPQYQAYQEALADVIHALGGDI